MPNFKRIAPGVAVVASAISFAHAQSLSGINITDSCKQAAISLVTGDFGSCTDLIGLVNVVTASGSVVQPLNSWVDSMCTSAPCSDSTLQSASDTIKSGCQEDINNNNDVVTQLDNVVNNYNNVRGVACLQYSGNGTWCAPYLLNNIETATGTDLSPTNVTNMFSSASGLQMLYQDTPASAVCNDCGQAVAFKAQNFDSSGGSNVKDAADSKCGDSFVGSQLPSTVEENAASAAEASSSSSDSGRSSSAESVFSAVTVYSLGAAALIASRLLSDAFRN